MGHGNTPPLFLNYLKSKYEPTFKPATVLTFGTKLSVANLKDKIKNVWSIFSVNNFTHYNSTIQLHATHANSSKLASCSRLLLKNPLRLQNPFTAFQGLGDFKVGINRKKFDRSVPFSSLTFEQIKLIHELIGIFIWPKNELKAYNEISPFAKWS